MSREIKQLNDTINIVRGIDSVIGYFIDMTDSRYAESGRDKQGEGYIMEWCQTFGFTNNLIKADVEDLASEERIIELANNFTDTLLN
jgi:hypothetical protein|tara:strand:- start:351 stop:611 length:261 start_codon:yes stop_codon:yes gene_type:complete